MHARTETLRRFIEHAPRDPGAMSPDLAGWKWQDGLEICAHCSGRIFARGCSLPDNPAAVWTNDGAAIRCCLCSGHKETTTL